MSLELEHKDGDNKNNARENLEALCPNCHSITETWRGRNKKSLRRIKITDVDRVCAFLETGNIRRALIKLNISPKGGNYAGMKRALTMHKINY